MPKIKGPIPIAVLAGILIYVLFTYFTQPAPTTHSTTATTHSAQTSSADPGNGLDLVTPADYTASFPRYTTAKRDPFIPAVLPANAGGKNGGIKGQWALTGINITNGSKTALLENKTTGDSVFLGLGDHWQGLHVVGIDDAYITFVNSIGQETQLAFAAPPVDNSPARTEPTPPVPSLGQIQPLPAIPALPAVAAGVPGGFPGGQNFRGGRGGGRRGRGFYNQGMNQ